MNRPDTDAQDQLLQIITFGLQRAAGPYRRAIIGSRCPHSYAANSLISAFASFRSKVSKPSVNRP